MDPDSDPDPAIFVIDLQDASQKHLIFNTIFSAYNFLKVHLHHFSTISQKGSQNSRNQCFSNYFCMMLEGSGSRAGSGSIPLTSGSGSGRPKNMWIWWIRIRIRIRNTDVNYNFFNINTSPQLFCLKETESRHRFHIF